MNEPNDARVEQPPAAPKEWTTPTLTPLDLADAESGVVVGGNVDGASSTS
jgi:hypothetical protein